MHTHKQPISIFRTSVSSVERGVKHPATQVEYGGMEDKKKREEKQTMNK